MLLLLSIGWGLLGWAIAIALNNLHKVVQHHRQARLHVAPGDEGSPVKPQLRWTTAARAFLVAWLLLLPAKGIVVVPSGMGGIRVSQTSGTRPGTLYPGVHWVTPLVESVALYDLRDHILTTSSHKDGLKPLGESDTKTKKAGDFTVQSKEGLSIGLAQGPWPGARGPAGSSQRIPLEIQTGLPPPGQARSSGATPSEVGNAGGFFQVPNADGGRIPSV